MFCRLLLMSVLLISRASELVAQEIGYAAGHPANGSPQFIYMERLHNKLAETKYLVGRNNSGGTLLATSIEADNSMGQGVSEDGFQFAGGNILELQFTIPKQRDATESNISKAELWLFPNMQSVPPGKLLEITLLATVTLPHANLPRRRTVSHSWKTDEGCVPLDMTFLTKKISKSLKKRGLTESNITVRIEVVRTQQYDLTLTDSHVGLGKNYLSICQDLRVRTSNISFLIVKYYDEALQGSTTNGALSASKHNRREAPSVQSNSKVGNCSLASMVVNLTEAYGQFVIAPIMKDIKDCQGNCQITSFDRYSSHALVKERLRWITGKDESKLSASCVPVAFDPLELLIHQESHFLIVEFPDMIAKGCGCR